MKIYIDGACAVHTGKNGAWAYVVVEDDIVVHEDSGFELETTNSRMELMSTIKALRWCIENKRLSAKMDYEIISDSSYVVNGITTWVKTWELNDWMSSTGTSVKNRDLWNQLNEASWYLNLKWTWVKGHSGEKWNEYVDSLCKIVAEQTPIAELIDKQ